MDQFHSLTVSWGKKSEANQDLKSSSSSLNESTRHSNHQESSVAYNERKESLHYQSYKLEEASKQKGTDTSKHRNESSLGKKSKHHERESINGKNEAVLEAR